MRKSVAPSQLQNPAKRRAFSGSFGENNSQINACSSMAELPRRTATDVLKLIEKCDVVIKDENEAEVVEVNDPVETATQCKTILNLPENTQVKETSYFNVLWGKLSTRKHKKWEGDGILEVKQKSAILRDSDGKEIASNFGYAAKQLASLDAGFTLKIGGKEVEILDRIQRDNLTSGKGITDTDHVESTTSTVVKRKVVIHRNPQKFPTFFKVNNPVPKFDPSAPDALVMPRPKQCSQWNLTKNLNDRDNCPIVDVVVDPRVSTKLRRHQREGVVFLYECVMGMRISSSCGAILADDMGLGKTLQCIALIWTLHKQGPYGGVPVAKKTLIVTPSSLVKNWKKEFHLWLGKNALNIFTAEGRDQIQEYARMPTSPVLILSYELLLRCHEMLDKIPFDLIICDEGHRLKNATTKTATLLSSLSIDRRIVLTGTPLQNDLQEFHAIVEFCNPGFLGTSSAFKRQYCDPIVVSRQPGATDLEKDIGEERAADLSSLTNLFVLRRTQEVNNEYLPPKMEFVIFCRPTALQLNLYKSLICSGMFDSCLSQLTDGALHLSCIMALRKVCNHPALLHSSARDESHLPSDLHREDFSLLDTSSLYPPNYMQHIPLEDSGKMQVLSEMLSALNAGEKIVLVSAFTKTLDLFEEMCSRKDLKWLRLDGSTASAKRQELVDRFNNAALNDTVFLLSLKAGGVGLNLNGASKIVLYDVDWNPANDLQAMARIWRDGQKNTAHIYRLLTTGTIEEKIFQRQVMKQGLSGAVIDSKCRKNVHFSVTELKKLFSLNEGTSCETHELIGCRCEGDGQRQSTPSQTKSRSCQLTTGKTDISNKNLTMDDLLSWRHYDADHVADIDGDEHVFKNCTAISFMFHNVSV